MLPDAPANPANPTGLESWSTQPPRYGDRRLPRGVWLIAGGVAVVVAVAVALIVRFGLGQTPVPDTRPLLLAVPADALACPQDNTLVSGDRVAHANSLPSAMASALGGSGLLSMAYRCWLQLDRSEVDVMLLRFDTAEHAARVVPEDQTTAMPGIIEVATVPGIPGARSFRLSAVANRLGVLGVRGSTAFVVFAKPGPQLDGDTIDQIAAQQYARL